MSYFEERPSDSPYVEAITHGIITRADTMIRPAETRWHLVLVRAEGTQRAIVVGPWTSAGVATFGGEAEVLWLRFKLGTYMPHMPVRTIINSETRLPEASSHRFLLDGTAWQFPDWENADTFVDRIVRRGVLARDALVDDVLQKQPHALASRTVRHRFLHATGLTQRHIVQVERAQRAAALLQQGTPIADTMFDLGYFDQPHLTRSLKQWVGHTPAQLLRMGASG
jgi:AraC-like DNA-binding protein